MTIEGLRPPEQPRNRFVFGVVPGYQALPVQGCAFTNQTKPFLAGYIVPAVATLAYQRLIRLDNALPANRQGSPYVRNIVSC